jgi:hypothetical protein
MPLYQTAAYTTTGTKASLNLDPSIAPFSATAVVGLSSGGSTDYKLQWSLDPMSVADADAVWFDSVNIPAGTASTAVTCFGAPVSRVRLIIASLTGSLTLNVAQPLSVN